MSCKDDAVIALLAEEAVNSGYQALSFDLPEHGDRKGKGYACNAENCVFDLVSIAGYAKTIADDISLFACSMGAYFSLLAYREMTIRKSLFLSPVLNMERIIGNMMSWFNVSEDRLRAEREIETPIGQSLSWDYYSYVKAHPVDKWNNPTSILYGSCDNITEAEVVEDFAGRYDCSLTVLDKGEHYFHTDEQMAFFRDWLKKNIN
ncbi:MAG: alpha/beta hydrolase [Clostridiales bacterium]|nr:alpha/beta hydrolase [Clostridiales bacterium]